MSGSGTDDPGSTFVAVKWDDRRRAESESPDAPSAERVGSPVEPPMAQVFGRSNSTGTNTSQNLGGSLGAGGMHVQLAQPSSPSVVFKEPRLESKGTVAQLAAGVRPPKSQADSSELEKSQRAAVNRGKQEIAKARKMTPELKVALRNALRDSADWHPRLQAAVAAITGMETSHCVRSRVYCTSASTMHSLLNVLLHGTQTRGIEQQVMDERQREAIEEVTDLNYLTHIVFRCYEEELGRSNGNRCETPPCRLVYRCSMTIVQGLLVIPNDTYIRTLVPRACP